MPNKKSSQQIKRNCLGTAEVCNYIKIKLEQQDKYLGIPEDLVKLFLKTFFFAYLRYMIWRRLFFNSVFI